MTVSHIAVFDTTLQKTHEWLSALVREGGFDDESQAYTAFRAVLHALRDRLIVNEAADLGAQLPMLIRGFYYEGWNPAKTPKKTHSSKAFLEDVEHELRNAAIRIDPEHAVRCVFLLLQEKITQGEIHDVRNMLTRDVKELWPPEDL